MAEERHDDDPRKETLFEFIRRAFQEDAGPKTETGDEASGRDHAPPSPDDPKSKARLEGGACHADGQ